MNELVKITENRELVVSLENISEFSGVKYESIQNLLKRNENEFAELRLALPKGNYDFKSQLVLNEAQATFLISLMKNNTIVKRFKLELVKEFMKMREFIKRGGVINNELKQHIEQFIPKTGYMEENPKGELKTKPVRGYFKVDKYSPYGLLMTKKYQLQKRVNSLLREDYEIEIKLVEQELAEIENHTKESA